MISEAKMCIKDGGPLLGAEYAVLSHLMANPNKILSEQEICEAVGMAFGGRSLTTTVSRIRMALGSKSCLLVTGRSVGYGWVGDPVECVPIVAQTKRKHAKASKPEFAIKTQCEVAREQRKHAKASKPEFAIKTQCEVARELGISLRIVRRIEAQALRKLAELDDLKDMFHSYLKEIGSYHYDPFYEIWLFQGAEKPVDAEDPQIPRE